MNEAKLIVDRKGIIYLEVNGKSFSHSVYFRVESFATEPTGRKINLTKRSMIVDLKEEE